MFIIIITIRSGQVLSVYSYMYICIMHTKNPSHQVDFGALCCSVHFTVFFLVDFSLSFGFFSVWPYISFIEFVCTVLTQINAAFDGPLSKQLNILTQKSDVGFIGALVSLTAGVKPQIEIYFLNFSNFCCCCCCGVGGDDGETIQTTIRIINTEHF